MLPRLVVNSTNVAAKVGPQLSRSHQILSSSATFVFSRSGTWSDWSCTAPGMAADDRKVALECSTSDSRRPSS